MIMDTKTKTLIPILLFALCMPLFAFAAEIRLDSHKAEVKTGEQFVVDVIVHSEEQLNAVEGRISFPADMLSVREIRDGNSVINFWVEKPRESASGSIAFSGITPGGFSGPNNFVFAVVFEAKSKGEITLTLQETTALRNDGAGTKESLTIRNVDVVIELGDSKVRKEELRDTELPEDFTPIVSGDKNLYEGKYSLIFAAQDKGTGILRYEVKEFRFAFLSFFSLWTIAESPYVLKDQKLKSYIVVKATDNSGNERISMVAPRYPLVWYDYLRVFAILIVALALCVFIFRIVWKRK